MFIRDRAIDVLADEAIGRTQALTPEGFLLCSGVRIARTGPMIYAADEMPEIEPDGGIMLTITRDADVLFADETLASFVGKPVTNDHPDDNVTPETWKQCAVGIVLNPRRGDGVEGDYLVADLLITDAEAIADVQGGRREVSCGYDSDREQIKPGLGRITRILGNHVALVDRGRCGPACAIQDGDISMSKRTVWDRLRTAFKAKDEAAFEEEMKHAMDTEAGESVPVVVHVHNGPAPADKGDEKDVKDEGEETKADPMAAVLEAIKSIDARMTALEQGGAKTASAETSDESASEGEKKDDDKKDDEESETKDEDKKDDEDKGGDKSIKDSAALRDEFTDTLARAEILAPGIKLPTFDAKKGRKLTVDAMCDLRRRALGRAYADEAKKPHVVAVLGGRTADFAKMTCDTAETIFRATSELVKAANNGDSSERKTTHRQGPMTPAKMQDLIVSRRTGSK